MQMRTYIKQENNFNECNKYYPRNLLQSFTFLGLYVLIMAIIFLLFNLLGYSERLPIENIDSLMLLISSIMLISFFKLVNRSKGLKTHWNIGLSWVTLIPILLIILFILQFGIIHLILDKLSFSWNKNELKNPFESNYHIFSVLILAPILEEIIYRGILLKGFLLTYPAKKAIILSTLLFGLVHFNVAHLEIGFCQEIEC